MRHVSYRYPTGETALEDISITVRPGECLILVGPNGSGKSTFLKLLAGLIFPFEGEVWAFGKPITPALLNDPEESYAFRRRVGLVLQNVEAQLFCPTVWDEVAFGPLHLGWDREQIEKRVDETLKLMQLESLRERFPHRLSGGEKKKVALASVLVIDPEVLLLDEPTANLDPRSQKWLLHFLMELTSQGKTVVMATHELHLLPFLADRIAILGDDHRLWAVGAPEEVLRDRNLLLRAHLVPEESWLRGMVNG
ncbi:ABC transporter related protein [Ammonifex degensii KC4]|uniref:ABC transporter related protein n=1 Tax=Ammonifex degensii (strain DSM 10501 / KC4) TaxID=429009 RepID=C9R7N7_AMMDK|nr:ABC transporter related protein [Ammonifex degensii KC4]